MSSRVPGVPGRTDAPGPLDGFAAIAEALEEPAGRASFARGVIIGAMVGAAIVGSVLRFRRERRSASRRGVGPADDRGGSTPPAPTGPTAAGGGPTSIGPR